MRARPIALTLLLVATVLAACSDGADPSTDDGAASSFEVPPGGTAGVATGTQGSFGSADDSAGPACFVAEDADALQRLWLLGDAGRQVTTGQVEVPDDLAPPTVGVFLGTRPTGGYAVTVTGGRVEDDGTVALEVATDEPGPDDVVTQALTSPYVLVSLPAVGVESPTSIRTVGDVEVTCERRVPEPELGGGGEDLDGEEDR